MIKKCYLYLQYFVLSLSDIQQLLIILTTYEIFVYLQYNFSVYKLKVKVDKNAQFSIK